MPSLVSAGAIPLEFTGFWLTLAIVLALGVTLVALGKRKHRKLLIGGGILVSGFAGVTIVQNLVAVSSMDVTPAGLTTDSIVGFWRDGNATIELRSDSTKRCSGVSAHDSPCNRAHTRSHWERRGEFSVTFLDPPTLTYHLARFNGTLYLVGPEMPTDTLRSAAFERGAGPYPVYDPTAHAND